MATPPIFPKPSSYKDELDRACSFACDPQSFADRPRSGSKIILARVGLVAIEYQTKPMSYYESAVELDNTIPINKRMDRATIIYISTMDLESDEDDDVRPESWVSTRYDYANGIRIHTVNMNPGCSARIVTTETFDDGTVEEQVYAIPAFTDVSIVAN